METITWELDEKGESTGIGKMVSLNHVGSCFNKKIGIERHVPNVINLIITEPFWNTDKNKEKYKNMYIDPYSSIRLIRPIINSFVIRDIQESIVNISIAILFDYLKNLKLSDKITDFEFLALLGLKRNWKKECAICLEEDIMGTTCTCGHTEIVIFRPCGHSVCIEPCFKELMASQNVNLRQGYVMIGDEKAYIYGKVDVNIDFNFKYLCPICRTKVIRTFRAEDVSCLYNKELLDKIKKEVTEKCLY